jgi:hypothetical protein
LLSSSVRDWIPPQWPHLHPKIQQSWLFQWWHALNCHLV